MSAFQGGMVMAESGDSRSSWWSTVPGMLTAAGALVAAVAGLLGTVRGLLDDSRLRESEKAKAEVERLKEESTRAKLTADDLQRKAAALQQQAETAREDAAKQKKRAEEAEAARLRADAEQKNESVAGRIESPFARLFRGLPNATYKTYLEYEFKLLFPVPKKDPLDILMPKRKQDSFWTDENSSGMKLRYDIAINYNNEDVRRLAETATVSWTEDSSKLRSGKGYSSGQSYYYDLFDDESKLRGRIWFKASDIVAGATTNAILTPLPSWYCGFGDSKHPCPLQ